MDEEIASLTPCVSK